MSDTATGQAEFTIYSTTTCGPCIRLKQRLSDLAIPYREVNVEVDAAAAKWVMAVNGGNRVVPTLEFADGSTLTNPSVDEVVERLSTMPR